MKKKLISLTKSSKTLYLIYSFCGNLVIQFIKQFIRPQNNLILFMSFGGKKFDDSPKMIYDAMVKDKRFSNYDFVWAFHEPGSFELQRAKKIKTDSFMFYIYALRAKVWISNSAIERGLSFKPKNTYYLNTWHGTPLKKMGSDISNKNSIIIKQSNIDTMLAQNQYEVEIFSKVFNVDRNNFAITGLPRNDILTSSGDVEVEQQLKLKIGIPLEKKVILYAPTFREYEKNTKLENSITPPIDIEKWKESLSKEYIFLLRAHYEVTDVNNVVIDNDFAYDVSLYHTLNDLLLITDILISDYSSIFFDYSIREKPMYCYTYDYENYEKERGLYFDIRDKLRGGDFTEEELINSILNDNEEEMKLITKRFKKEFILTAGKSTVSALDLIYENLT